MSPEIEAAWRHSYGTSFDEVIGRGPVKSFSDHGVRYRVGEVIDIYPCGGTPAAPVPAHSGYTGLSGEIITAGSVMTFKRKDETETSRRRAVILRVARSDRLGTYKEGVLFGIFLWDRDGRRIFHNLLETMARIA